MARSFARHTGFRPAAYQWAVDELADVLGLDFAGARPVKWTPHRVVSHNLVLLG